MLNRSKQRRSGQVTAAFFLCVLLSGNNLRGSAARSLQVQNTDSCSRRVFWFMAITSRSSLEYWRYGEPSRNMSLCGTERSALSCVTCNITPLAVPHDFPAWAALHPGFVRHKWYLQPK